MKLALKNIREYRAREYQFPERGLVLLKGESGAGKSTLLDVISFALFDNRRGLKTFNTSTCGVELEGFGITLKRTKNPNTLLVNELEGAVAQGEIERRLGMSETEFMASCYIVQDLYGSLLTLSPADQLKLIQKLACGDDDPEKVKERIRSLVRRHEVAIAEAEGQMAALRAMREEKLAVLSRLVSLEVPVEAVTAAEIAGMEQEAGAVEQHIKTIRAQILANAEAWRDPYFALVERLADAERDRVRSEGVANEKFRAIEVECASVGVAWGAMSQDQVSERREALAVEIATLEKAVSARTNLERLLERNERDRSSSATDLEQYLAAELERLRVQTEAGRQRRDEVGRELYSLELARHAQECPACHTPLVMVDGRLEKSGHAEAEIHERHVSLMSERDALRRTVVDLASATNLVQADHMAVTNLVEQFGEAAPDEVAAALKALHDEMAELGRYATSQRQIEQKLASLNAERRGIEQSMAARRAELAAMKAELKATEAGRREAKSRADLEAERRQLDASLARWESQAVEIGARLAEARVEQARYFELLRQFARRRELEASVEDLDERIAEKKAAARLGHDRYEAALRLRELSDRAATDAVSSILNTINIHAQRYLEALFVDTGTSVYLLNEKELGSGETRAKLDVEIFHKGARYTSLRDLSGGERSRITLAFQLALCEIYRSPIFMLDEGMKGLDPESKMRCLEILREAADERLVLVVEHGAPESAFDDVIHVAARA